MAGRVLFVGGLDFDGLGETLEGHGVLVEGERIAAVSPADAFDGFTDGARIDTSGQTLLPGLIDCHVHLVMGAEGDPAPILNGMAPGQITMRALRHAQETVAGGVTAVRDCGGKD